MGPNAGLCHLIILVYCIIVLHSVAVVLHSRAREGRKYVWHGVWSLILLLYAPLLFTCTSLLHCAETPSVRGEEEANVSDRGCVDE